MKNLIIVMILSVLMIFFIIKFPRKNYRVCWKLDTGQLYTGQSGQSGHGPAKFSKKQHKVLLILVIGVM